jgi:hypothetical protein
MGRWSRRGKDAVAATEYDVEALAAGQKTVRSETLPHGKITMIQPSSQPATTIRADDPERNFTLARSDDPNSPHIGLVGDTYTILVAGKDTAGRTVSSTCTFHLAAALHLIAMISKRCSLL